MLYQAARAFEEGLSELLEWIKQQSEILVPPGKDAGILQEQIDEIKVTDGAL